jgi:hypothetical protein
VSSANKGWFEPVWTPIYDNDPGDEDDQGAMDTPGWVMEEMNRESAEENRPEEEVFDLRHPSSMKFHRYLKEIANLHDIKQRDYGRESDPFANVRASEEWGIEGWVGAMIRLNDKVRRLQVLAVNGKLSNEGAIDSFNDIACYSLIARILYEDEFGS